MSIRSSDSLGAEALEIISYLEKNEFIPTGDSPDVTVARIEKGDPANTKVVILYASSPEAVEKLDAFMQACSAVGAVR